MLAHREDGLTTSGVAADKRLVRGRGDSKRLEPLFSASKAFGFLLSENRTKAKQQHYKTNEKLGGKDGS